jgi:hypothetical protein
MTNAKCQALLFLIIPNLLLIWFTFRKGRCPPWQSVSITEWFSCEKPLRTNESFLCTALWTRCPNPNSLPAYLRTPPPSCHRPSNHTSSESGAHPHCIQLISYTKELQIHRSENQIFVSTLALIEVLYLHCRRFMDGDWHSERSARDSSF